MDLVDRMDQFHLVCLEHHVDLVHHWHPSNHSFRLHHGIPFLLGNRFDLDVLEDLVDRMDLVDPYHRLCHLDQAYQLDHDHQYHPLDLERRLFQGNHGNLVDHVHLVDQLDLVDRVLQ